VNKCYIDGRLARMKFSGEDTTCENSI